VLKVIYSMIIHSEKTHLLYAIVQVNMLSGSNGIERERERERNREKEGRVRD
jgi:hypothetical protein